MTLKEQIRHLEAEIVGLRNSNDRLAKENGQLRDRLAEQLWPAEEKIEQFEQSVLKATKTLLDHIRG